MSDLVPVAARSLVESVRLHPRVAELIGAEACARFLDELPPLLPFRRAYLGAIVVVDWDHHLPPRTLLARLYLYCDATRLAEGERAYAERLARIRVRDKFPEFDVPDFGDLPADESYEATLDATGAVKQVRLVSAWRREVDAVAGRDATAIARASADFAQIVASAVSRPRNLGDLEAVSWTPPCETGHPVWTLDVWYLLAFDGRTGTGRGLLVDLADRKVVKVRDFSVRAG